MSANSLFEEFGRLPSGFSSDPQDEEKLEDAKLQSFEQGYGAGWEDAIEAQKKAEKLLADTQTSLAEVNITKDQAFVEFSNAMRPVLEAALQSALPDLANRAMPDHVRAQLDKLLASGRELKPEIRVSSDQYQAVSKVLSEYENIEAEIREDKAISPGQAYLAFGNSEISIDLPEMIEDIKSAIEMFYFSLNEEN